MSDPNTPQEQDAATTDTGTASNTGEGQTTSDLEQFSPDQKFENYKADVERLRKESE